MRGAKLDHGGAFDGAVAAGERQVDDSRRSRDDAIGPRVQLPG